MLFRSTGALTAVASLAVITTACGSLGGWALDVPVLTSFGGSVRMNPATAICLIACALSLWLGTFGRGGTRGVARVLAALVALVGALRIAGYWLGAEIEIDRLLFPDQLLEGDEPNRMALTTAIALVGSGIALLVVDVETRRGLRPAEPIAASAGLVALVSLTGHAYQARLLSRGTEHAIPMAELTALAFLTLTVAILASRPRRGWVALLTGEHAGAAMARRLLPVVVGLPLVLGFVALHAVHAAACGPATGFATFAVANLVVVAVVVLATARTLGRTDLAVRAAHDAEQRLRSQLERVSDASLAIADAVSRDVDADDTAVLQTIADHARAVALAQYAVIAFGTDPEQPFSPRAQSGMSAEVLASLGEPHPVGVRGLVAREGQVVRARDVREHPAFGGLPAGHPEITSFLAVPVRYRGRTVGNLYLGNKLGGAEFTLEDERAISLLSSHVGVALENARSYRAAVLERLRLAAVLEQLPEGVVVRDADGQVIVYNRTARSLSAQADRLLEVCRPSGEPMPRAEHPVERALRGGETVIGAEAQLPVAGRRVPVLVNAAPIRDAQGAPAGAVAVFQDISALKEIERMREEWNAVIAHDLRQPANVIVLSATLLDQRLSRAEDRKVVAGIMRAGRNLGVMIGDLLDVSRLEANQLDLRRTKVDVAGLARELIERSMALDPEHPVRLEVHGESATAWVDAARIEQVVGNLLSNAIKYGDRGTEILVVVEGRGTELELAVTNHGPGMAEAELERLFERFYRTRRAKHSGVDGIGLGLYLCRGIVEAHGGSIAAESVAGETTTLRVTLPRAEIAR